MDHPHIAPLMFLLTTLATSPVVAKEVLDVATRGVFVRLLIEAPATPQAVAVLFAGGKGVLGILDDGQLSWGSGNFVVRSRGYFLNHGIATALIDGPSDRPRELWGFRETEQHATDIGAVISALRKRFGVPVWLVGTSRGTVSVAHAGVRLQQHGADGIALTASVLLANRRGAGILACGRDSDIGDGFKARQRTGVYRPPCARRLPCHAARPHQGSAASPERHRRP